MEFGRRVARATTQCTCDFCENAIPMGDFEEGQAAVVLGKAYCSSCVQIVSQKGAGALRPAGSGAERRRYPRFVPSLLCDLVLLRPGFLGRLAGNLVRTWLDVSEEGLRALVRRRCAAGERLAGRILYRPTKRSFEMPVLARHVVESQQSPGSFVIGAQFENPSPDFRSFIRDVHGKAGILEPEAATKKFAKGLK